MTPLTDAGRIFTVFYGLLGIPLMFITAADIGKFLSDLVIKTYGKLLAIFTWAASVCDAIRDYIVQPDDESIESRLCTWKFPCKKYELGSIGNAENDEDADSTMMKTMTMMRTRKDCNCQFSVILLWWSDIVPLAVPFSMPGNAALFGEGINRDSEF